MVDQTSLLSDLIFYRVISSFPYALPGSTAKGVYQEALKDPVTIAAKEKHRALCHGEGCGNVTFSYIFWKRGRMISKMRLAMT